MIVNRAIHGFVVISLVLVALGTLQAAPVREQRLAVTVAAIGGGNAVAAGIAAAAGLRCTARSAKQ